MSFIVQIIDAALPGDATQRQRMIDQLVEQHQSDNAGPGAALGKLYQQLVAQYPCLSTYKEDGIDECVWGDGPLIGNFGQKIAVLNIAQNQEQVLAVILKLAGELNLKVVDVQEELVYYPKSQEAADFIKAHEKPAVKEKPLTEKSVLDFIVARLKPLFEPAGFVWNKKEKWAERTVPYGTQRLWLSVEKRRYTFAIYLTARFDIPAVGELVQRVTGDLSVSEYTVGCNYPYFTGRSRPPEVEKLGNVDELVQITNLIEDLTKTTVLPFFETTLDLEKLSSAINNPEKCGYFMSTFFMQALSLAFLVQPSKIRETADIYRNCIKSLNYSEEAYMKPIDNFVTKLIALNPTL
ncbi:hypothetical protein H8K47_06250 [Undibacterium sp. CY7W]|uniref:Uncharacterized protein n=1 Tax=Undibacterium rugosum TaxID=2762291 RepID=A0A923KZE6_9BURK|nr:hypothetical protein [Undibacterium rugosum]MBC3934956.1 hypothetical protein [Undibacterium rugosum]